MIAAVIPAKNESARIRSVLTALSHLPIQLMIPVANGCRDDTFRQILRHSNGPTQIIYSSDPLGMDVPRSAGAKIALDSGADYILFVDGDMTGVSSDLLEQLIYTTIGKKLDLALTNCYPESLPDNPLGELVVYFRSKLNDKIGLSAEIGAATPSHGPHMVSRLFLETVPLTEIALPPVSLALAAKNALHIGIGLRTPHRSLGSPSRGNRHALNLSKTIIGDCIEAMHAYDGSPRRRSLGAHEYIGYHAQRNWQLLQQFLGGKGPITVFELNKKRVTPNFC